MIGWFVKVLTGGSFAGAFGPWILLGAVLVIGGAGFTAGNYARGVTDAPTIAKANQLTAEANGRTDQCRAIHEKGRADGAEQVIASMLANAKVASGIMNELVKKAAARNQSLAQLLKDIANAPSSKTCGGVAAELAFRRSVQPPTVPATAP